MIPNSFSASALHVASLCLARYAAENYKHGDRLQNDAAGLGTSVHGGLENFVKLVFMDQTHERSEKLLLDLYDIEYLKQFGNLDKSEVNYKDGVDMLKRWYKRGDLWNQNRKVVSVETKTNFPVKIAGYPETPFNYIWDRFDQMLDADEEYTVVDYKSNRFALNRDQLRKKLQAKAYGLAAQIQLPQAKRIWVEFDFLRHDGGPVGTVFTREDNIETWNQFKAQFYRIWETDEDNAPETLNAECGWCVKKQTCSAMRSNVSVGGLYAVGSIEEMADRRRMMEDQRAGLSSAIQEIDNVLLAYCKENDVFNISTDETELEIGVSSRRGIDGERAEQILGPELWHKYGSASITVATVDNLLKGGELTPEQKRDLKMCIGKNYGDPKIKTVKKS